MPMSLRDQWKLNALYFVGNSTRAALFLEKQSQQQTQTEQSSLMTASKSFHSIPALATNSGIWVAEKFDPILPKAQVSDASPFSGRGAWLAKGSTQVTDVPCETQGTSEFPRLSQGNLAGSSPHAPHPPRRERRKRRSTARKNFTIRMSDDIRAKLEAKAAAAESYPSAYVLKLVAADLCLPIDEAQTERSRGLQEQIAALTVALNKQGGLFNQIAAALNRGQPCPVTRQEIDAAWHRHIAATNAIIKLGFDS